MFSCAYLNVTDYRKYCMMVMWLNPSIFEWMEADLNLSLHLIIRKRWCLADEMIGENKQTSPEKTFHWIIELFSSDFSSKL